MRGVYLTWLAPANPAGAGIIEYEIERVIQDEDDFGDTVDAKERTFYNDREELGDQVRSYRVRARNAAGNGGWSKAVVYPLQDHTHNTSPTAVGTIAPVTVTAGKMSDAMDVSGYFSDADMGDALTYTAMSDMEMYATADIPAGSSMLTITGVAAGSATVMVTATDAAGAYAMQTIMVTVEAADTTLGNAMGLVGAVGSESNTIALTWTVGDNADIHWVFGIHTSYDIASLVWEAADASDSHTVDMTGKPRGSYTFFVIAGQTDDAGDTEWSAWTPGTVTY